MAMTELVRRREAEAPTAYGFWEPARLMREFLRWDPIREPMAALGTMPNFAPDFDVKETKEAYVLKADLPGVREEDLSVSVAGSRLTVSGKREAEEKRQGETFYAIERMHGSFTRAFTLPEGADPERVQADLKDGVLTLLVPKRPEEKTRQVPVKTLK
jgi:HSP20 family protein